MKEHRLIERMIKVIETELKIIEDSKKIDNFFIMNIIDFFRIYADRIHHGKEEDILFESLKKIQISEEHKKIMDQLVNYHKNSREIIKTLETLNQQFIMEDLTVFNEIQKNLYKLVFLYPKHIEI